MRIHGLACGYVVFFALKMGVSREELACLLLAMGMVTAAEALNTSVEKLCDFSEPRRNEKIGRVKDIAAGGVLFSALFAALAGCTVLLRPALWPVVLDITCTPWKLVLFLATLVGSALLVFAIPQKRDGEGG